MKHSLYLELRKVSILTYIILSFFVLKNEINNDNFQKNIFKFQLKENNNILISYIGEDKILKGNITGELSNSVIKFENSNISCDFLGRSYTGRGFSCGFSELKI